MDELHGHRSFTDSGSHTFYRTVADIANGKDAGNIGFEQERIPVERPSLGALANAVFQPLARLIHSFAAVALEESKLLTRAMLLLTEEKPLADLRRLFESAGGAVPAEAAPAVSSAAGGGQ